MKKDRLTISLAVGQRKALKKIAGKRHGSVASVIRCALEQFIKMEVDSPQSLHDPQNLPNDK